MLYSLLTIQISEQFVIFLLILIDEHSPVYQINIIYDTHLPLHLKMYNYIRSHNNTNKTFRNS